MFTPSVYGGHQLRRRLAGMGRLHRRRGRGIRDVLGKVWSGIRSVGSTVGPLLAPVAVGLIKKAVGLGRRRYHRRRVGLGRRRRVHHRRRIGRGYSNYLGTGRRRRRYHRRRHYVRGHVRHHGRGIITSLLGSLGLGRRRHHRRRHVGGMLSSF
jgi:hypothetical protein